MDHKELKRLNREMLLEMLLEQSKEVERLKMQNAELKEQLENRQILIKNAGSIAEAALQINRIFETAQQAADQYLENVQRMCGAQTDRKK